MPDNKTPTGAPLHLGMDALVDRVAASTNLTKQDVRLVIRNLTDQIIAEVKDGYSVQIAGFGKWTSRRTKARTGRNPKTGATVTVPAKFRPKFAFGKTFTDEIEAAKRATSPS